MYGTGRPRHPAGYFRGGTAPEGLGLGPDEQPEGGEAGEALRASDSYADYLDWAFARGTTPNGVFGTKLMWGYMYELVRYLRDLPGLGDRSTAELLDEVFPNARYVHISRGDKVEQAVSMWKALQTAAWREGSKGSNRAEPRYDYGAIDRLRRCLEADDAAWPDFFAHNDIDALRITYEQLVAAYGDTLERVFRHIGVEPPPDLQEADHGMRRQADSTSTEWVERYRAERVAPSS